MSIYRYIVELRFLSAICIAALIFYRNHLDDKKWFKCAFKAVYGKHSCADYMLQSLREKPFLEGFYNCYVQLKSCEEASRVAHKCSHLKNFDGKTYILLGGTYMLVSACTHDNSPPPIDPSRNL